MPVTNHHWIQIDHRSDSVIEELIRTGHAELSDRRLKGVRGPRTWLVKANAEVTILSDAQLSIAGRTVSAQLSCFSTPMYAALVAGSPSFTQYGYGGGLDELYRQVRRPEEGWNPAEFARSLEEVVRAGRQPDVQPRLLVKSALYTARWKPNQVYLRQDKCGDWFLALVFDVQHIPGRQHPERVAIGLDVGLKPLTVACTGKTFTTFQASNLEHLRGVTRCDLTPGAQDLLAQLVYAMRREDTQQIIEYLNQRASRVYAEDLNLKGMTLGYVKKARASAIHDHHFSDLPQSMYASGIMFKRVPAHFTSVRCARCYRESGIAVYGQRQGHQLTCHRCKRTYDSHVVASCNVWIEGEERYGLARRR